jgi:hypothetical protein
VKLQCQTPLQPQKLDLKLDNTQKKKKKKRDRKEEEKDRKEGKKFIDDVKSLLETANRDRNRNTHARANTQSI